jgi:hypothetical protein
MSEFMSYQLTIDQFIGQSADWAASKFTGTFAGVAVVSFAAS